MKKYYFKGTNQEVKLDDKITQIITCSNGKQFKCNSIVDEATIEDLLNRNSIEAKEVTPVQKSIYRTHGKTCPMSKEFNGKRCPIPKESNGKRCLMSKEFNGKRGPIPKESNVKIINLNNKEEFKEFLNILTGIINGKCQ